MPIRANLIIVLFCLPLSVFCQVISSDSIQDETLVDSLKQNQWTAESCERELLNAVKNKDYNLAQKLLEADCDPNGQERPENISRDCPLTWAVSQNDTSMIQLLLHFGADPNYKRGDSWLSPFHFAAGQETEAFSLLLAAGGDVNTVSKHRYTPIYKAILKGRLENVKLLIEAGAPLEPDSLNFNYGPLHIAAIYGQNEIIKYLLEKGVNPNALYYEEPGGDCYVCFMNVSPIEMAAGSPDLNDEERLSTVRLLCENGAAINETEENDYDPLHFAVLTESEKTIEYLLEKGADIGLSLIEAARQPNVNTMRILIEAGADVNLSHPRSGSPINNALFYTLDGPMPEEDMMKRLPAVELLLDAGAKVDQSTIDAVYKMQWDEVICLFEDYCLIDD
ncbi:ankyrin repeat domain-containing protein [Reichenbachiella ulvae]|uniref:Ankyrin repeat domain-containing protein n=1 Tax=Reichenbachiella ulvae TaxID=2980104 RepID=A0ABT3CZA1_9BACT|nr:ankyrin repeat domain-containing protein [Reichenbachiella ulvae]MCV9388883.1 ankyrin repeat domain-containing protein [Reichenbachiella ulvae]